MKINCPKCGTEDEADFKGWYQCAACGELMEVKEIDADPVTFEVLKLEKGIMSYGVQKDLPVIFLDLKGCTMPCKECIINQAEGKEMLMSEIMSKVSEFDIGMIVLGKEFMHVPNILKLLRVFNQNLKRVSALTCGSIFQKQYCDAVQHIIFNIHLPSSGRQPEDVNLMSFVTNVHPKMEIVARVKTDEDFELFQKIHKEILYQYDVTDLPWTIIVNPKEIKKYQKEILKKNLNIRVH